MLSAFVVLFFNKVRKHLYFQRQVRDLVSLTSTWPHLGQFCCALLGRSRSWLEGVYVTKEKKQMVPVRLSLKYQEDYPAGTKISCSHRGYISNASSGYNHHVPHILISSVLAQAHARVSSHMAATPCNPMEKNCSWQICGVTWSYRNHQLLRMSGPGSPEFASSSKKLQIQSWALSCLSRTFVASSPCEVTPVLTVPTTLCLPPSQLQVFGWDLKVRIDLCVCHTGQCLHTTVMRLPSVNDVWTSCLQRTKEGKVLSIF